MWKFFTRSIRETLELRSCRTNVYSQSSQDGNNNNIEQKEILAPSFSTICHDSFGKSKHSGPKEKEEQSKYDAEFTWIDAVSWSGFLAVGYIVCQSLCIHRKLFDIDNTNLKRWRNKFLIYPQTQVFQLVNHSVLPQPSHILAISDKLNKSENTVKILNDRALRIQKLYGPFTAHISTVNNELKESDDTPEFTNDNASNIQNLYGPITAQEAFEKAANEFSSTHQMIMGELELDCGSKALEEKRYEDAIEHFITGTKLSSAGSMFNLALCYELGLGTSVDYKKAVKYYKRAATKGHIDAMYNLGVFYAQGKGGLKINKDTARQLFMDAAKKGQIQALKALQLEESFKKHSDLKQDSKYCLKITSTNNSIKNNILTKLNSYSNILMTNINDQTVKNDEFINSFDDRMNSKNSTDMFLDIIGIHK